MELKTIKKSQRETTLELENLGKRSVLHAFATGQERRNKPESSAAKLYCLHLQEPESKRARALLLTSLGARAQERKRARARARERMAKPRPF